MQGGDTAGRAYNLVVFGAILLSVMLLLFEGHTLESAEARVLELLEEATLAVFVADFLLHLLVSPKPLAYLFSSYGLIDLHGRAVLLRASDQQRPVAVGV